MTRKLPNILITGTPGTGKSTLCELVAACTGMRHMDISRSVKENGWHESYDEEYQCFVIDEDKVCDELERDMKKGGVIIDLHSAGFFPERWFDLVVVLRTDNTILFDRLTARNYPQKKISENVQAEIMQVVLEDTEESFLKEIIWTLQSDSILDMESNAIKIQEYYDQFVASIQGQKTKKRKSSKE